MDVSKLIANLPSRSLAERAAMRRNAESWSVCSDAAKVAAAREVLEALDVAEAAETQAIERAPLSDRVLRAFRERPWSDHQRKLIQVLLDHPGSTTTELNQLAGLGDNMVWQMHFGNMCKDRADLLGMPPAAMARDGNFWSGLLADAEPGSNRFTMKPEAASAFAALGLKPAKPQQS